MRSKKNQKRSLQKIVPQKATKQKVSKNAEKKTVKKVNLLKNGKKSRKSQDEKLIETYGGELVDLTDLTNWGEFDAEYEEPKGRREQNKILKKVPGGKSKAEEWDEEDDSEGDSDLEENGLRPRRASDSDESMDEDDDDLNSDENSEMLTGESDIEEDSSGVDDESDELLAMETSDLTKHSDIEEEPMEKMPFKGPLAVNPKTEKQKKRKPSSLLDGVDNNSDDEVAESENEQEASDVESVTEDVIVELTENEKKLMKNWELYDLDVRIAKALAELNFSEPTEIQSHCLTPAIRDRQDILGAAETGSGKTLAFGIPLVQRLLHDKCKNKLGALILTPTRELAVQIKKHLMNITKHSWLHVICIVGGLSHEKQMRLLAKGPEIIVATPGRLFELVQEDPSLQGQLVDVKCLVIDEADRMIQKGHFEEMQLILKFMNSNRTGKRQNFVFSATLTMDPHLPARVVEKSKKKLGRLDQLKALVGMPKPKVIDLSKKLGTAETLVESRIFCEKPEQKDALLYYFLLVHPGRTLVFCNSIDCVRRLKSVLEALRLKPMGLHAEMQQRQRLKHLDRFAATPNSLLIATDVAARGLDIKNIEHVIHFNVSKASETYVHRSGRTARSRKDGLSVMLVDGRELPQYRKLLHALKRNKDLPAFPVDEDVLKVCKMRVAKARELEQMQFRLNKRVKSDGWFEKCAKDADIELDSDLVSSKDWNEDRKAKIKLDTLKHELQNLLNKRLVPLKQKVGASLSMPEKDPLKLVKGARGVLE